MFLFPLKYLARKGLRALGVPVYLAGTPWIFTKIVFDLQKLFKIGDGLRKYVLVVSTVPADGLAPLGEPSAGTVMTVRFCIYMKQTRQELVCVVEHKTCDKWKLTRSVAPKKIQQKHLSYGFFYITFDL